MTLVDKAQRNFSQLIVVRKKGEPSPAAAEAIGHIERLVESGRVAQALAEAQRLPGAAAATNWMEAARRYTTTRRAFDLLERSAITMPATAPVPPTLPVPPPVASAPPAGVTAAPVGNSATPATDEPLW